MTVSSRSVAHLCRQSVPPGPMHPTGRLGVLWLHSYQGSQTPQCGAWRAGACVTLWGWVLGPARTGVRWIPGLTWWAGLLGFMSAQRFTLSLPCRSSKTWKGNVILSETVVSARILPLEQTPLPSGRPADPSPGLTGCCAGASGQPPTCHPALGLRCWARRNLLPGWCLPSHISQFCL